MIYAAIQVTIYLETQSQLAIPYMSEQETSVKRFPPPEI
jgi:hypothetical protein